MYYTKSIKVLVALTLAGVMALSVGMSGCDRKEAPKKTEAVTSDTSTAGKEKEKPKNSIPTFPTVDANGKRLTNFFGIHSMIYPADNIAQHLDWAKHLVGEGGYIKERFEPITKNTKGPSSHWVKVLKEIYKRNLIPVIRVAGIYDAGIWQKPEATGKNDFSELAAAIKSVFEQIPLKKGTPVYVEVFNETNLRMEWGNEMPDPREYGHLLVQVADALHSIGDPRIRVMNGALSPGGDYDNVRYVDAMVKSVPESLWAFDVWASHPYPFNHPPEYNIHDGTAVDKRQTIDSYLLELKQLEKHGRKDVKVILTETGYELGNEKYKDSPMKSENFPAITEENRADYAMRAFRDYWAKWPEVLAACPYELSAVQNKVWNNFDWVYIYSGSDANGYPTDYTPQYKAVADLPKPPLVMEEALADTEDKNMEVQYSTGNLAVEAKDVTSSTSIEDYGWTLSKINNTFTTDADLGWSSNGDEQPEWVQYEFADEKEMGKVTLVPRSDGSEVGKYFPQAFEIQVSQDGSNWSTVYSQDYKENGMYNPGSQPQTFTFDPVKGKYIRLYITQKASYDGGGYHAQLSEWEVYSK